VCDSDNSGISKFCPDCFLKDSISSIVYRCCGLPAAPTPTPSALVKKAAFVAAHRGGAHGSGDYNYISREGRIDPASRSSTAFAFERGRPPPQHSFLSRFGQLLFHLSRSPFSIPRSTIFLIAIWFLDVCSVVLEGR